MRVFYLLPIAAVALAVYAGCSDSKPAAKQQTAELKESAMTIDVSIKLGEMGPDFAKRYPSKVKVQKQPAGLDFYEIDWKRPRGSVNVEHGKHSVVIHDVLSVLASQDLEAFKAEGLKDFYVSSGVTAPDLIPHDEARQKIHAILRGILNVGWQQVIELSEPRLKGRARLDYMFATTNSNGLDATHLPTFEEWMRIPSRTPWSFYANGVYMDVTFTREPTLTDPNKPGSYLLTFKLKTETQHLRGYAGPDNRLRWKEFVPAELAKAAEQRKKLEAELRAKGVPIDESYQDPPLPAFK
jgi:hypothetical protein